MKKNNVFNYPGSMKNTFINDEKNKRPQYNLDGSKGGRKRNKLLNLPKGNIPRKVK